MKSDCPIKKIIKRDGSVVAYNPGRISNAILKATASTDAPNARIADAMSEKVEAALISTYGSETMPSVEDIQDVVENVLMENRLTRVARNYIIYRHQRAMARAARAYSFEVTDNVPYKKLYEVLRWNMDHSCDSIQNLNKLIKSGGYPSMVKEADKRYVDEIKLAADLIIGNQDNIRIAIVAGPSSSGKTTTTIKVSEQLNKAGIGFKAINIDNYFFNLEKHPKDEFDDYPSF